MFSMWHCFIICEYLSHVRILLVTCLVLSCIWNNFEKHVWFVFLWVCLSVDFYLATCKFLVCLFVINNVYWNKHCIWSQASFIYTFCLRTCGDLLAISQGITVYLRDSEIRVIISNYGYYKVYKMKRLFE